MVKNLYYKGQGEELPTLTNPAPVNRVLDGYDYINASGARQEGTVSSRSGYTITPGRYSQTVAANQYLTGNITIAGSSNLTAGNIRSGVNLFGVNGSYEGESTGVYANVLSFARNGGFINFGFRPKYFILINEDFERAANTIWGFFYAYGLSSVQILGNQNTINEQSYQVSISSSPSGYSSIAMNITSSTTFIDLDGTSNGWNFQTGASYRVVGME